jgi:hypothetical protein
VVTQIVATDLGSVELDPRRRGNQVRDDHHSRVTLHCDAGPSAPLRRLKFQSAVADPCRFLPIRADQTFASGEETLNPCEGMTDMRVISPYNRHQMSRSLQNGIGLHRLDEREP